MTAARLGDACSPAPEVELTGFVCPPCGRFIRTDLDGVLFRARTGSAPRFCSPGCRQAAYRRRRAGAEESVRLQHRGDRRRRLVVEEPMRDHSWETPESKRTKEPR
jgi:hypothetical protein